MPLRNRLVSMALLVMAWVAMPVHATVQITDDQGVSVSFDRPPQRIVSLLPSLAETVCELGQCQRLVGVDPRRVERAQAEVSTAVYVYEGGGGAWAFAARLHETLAAEDWYGLELGQLAAAWAARAPGAVVVVWVGADDEEAAGTPVTAMLAALAGAGPGVTAVRAGLAPEVEAG